MTVAKIFVAGDEFVELRKLIRDMIVECYGWPVEKEEHIYGVKPVLGKVNPKDPKNSELVMPKGPNTRTE